MYNKDKIAAYLIMESPEPTQVSNLEVYNKNSLFYVRFTATLQEFNVFNRNKRMYMGDAMVPSLNAEHLAELQANGSWFGEAGHPDSTDPKRILTIDPKLISHKIVSHTVDRQWCKGVIETLPTKHGTEMTKLIIQGMQPAFSLRALAPLVKQGDGTALVKSKAHVVTYDWVILPSHKTAYIDKSKPVERVVKGVMEDGNAITTEGAMISVEESALMDYITEESFNLKVVSNVCEVCTSGARLSKDNKNVILREGNETYIVPIESKIRRDIADYFSKL